MFGRRYRRTRGLALACMLTLCAGGPVAVAAAPTQAPHPAVARISVVEPQGHAFGSGTLVDVHDRYGLVVTNWHVVEGAAGPITVTFPSGFQSEARALKLDEAWDLAALVVWRPPAVPVRIAAAPPSPGEPLTICGYGQGTYRAVTGRCRDFYSPKEGYPQEIVELDVEARQGDSGGPIFNQRGELAGVLFGAGEGSTLGSFGPRVNNFLATLAPGAGRLAGGPTASPHANPSQQQYARVSASGLEPIVPPEPPADIHQQTPQPPLLASHPAAGFPPQVPAEAAMPPAPSFAPTPDGSGAGLDLFEEGKSILALVGLAALLIQGVRLVS